MPQVKIVLVKDFEGNQDDYNSTSSILVDSISDWEEINDEDLNFLEYNLSRLFNYGPYRPIIVKKDIVPVYERVKSIKDMIQKEQDRRQREEEAEIKRKEAKSKKTKLQRFEKLQEQLKAEGLLK